MPDKVALQILYLMSVYDRTKNQYIAICLKYLWNNVSIHKAHANELSPRMMTKVKRIVNDELNVIPDVDIDNFANKIAPSHKKSEGDVRFLLEKAS